MKHVSAKTVRRVTTAAALAGGALAGADIDRAIVQFPAFRELGASRWAEYSRHADLSRGLVLYPLEGIGGAVLSIASAVVVGGNPRERSAARLASCVAALLALGGMAITAKAAPAMLSLRNVQQDDLAGEQRAFNTFRYWSYLRAVCQVLAFAGNVATLAMLSRGDATNAQIAEASFFGATAR
jgi:hypothetical protein